MNVMIDSAMVVVAYLLGSFPSALIVGRKNNVDIRQHGSGNLGGTNTFRVLGKKAGFTVSIADLLKGSLAALVGLLVGGSDLAVFTGMAAVFGHSFPLFAQFRGGKSVATGGGVLLVLSPLATIAAIAVFAALLFTVRIVSLSSILTALAVAFFTFLWKDDSWIRWGTLLIALFVIYRHKANIVRLRNGTEKKVFQRKSG